MRRHAVRLWPKTPPPALIAHRSLGSHIASHPTWPSCDTHCDVRLARAAHRYIGRGQRTDNFHLFFRAGNNYGGCSDKFRCLCVDDSAMLRSPPASPPTSGCGYTSSSSMSAQQADGNCAVMPRKNILSLSEEEQEAIARSVCFSAPVAARPSHASVSRLFPPTRRATHDPAHSSHRLSCLSCPRPLAPAVRPLVRRCSR